MSAKTSVVIPNYNGAARIEDCLRALREQTLAPDRIIVVDNGSTDQSIALIKAHFPEVELIALPENTGFCGAVNRGIEASWDMDYVILLNDDTKVQPSFTKELIAAMQQRPQAFSCQAKMLKMSEPDLIDDAGDLYCALGWAFAQGKGKPEENYNKVREIFSCCAGAAIYRISALKRIGCFDENHFAYLEDTDIGWRARLFGYHNYFIPQARVLHVGSATSGSIYNLFKVKNTSKNSIYLIGKNMPIGQVILNLPLLAAGFFVKAIFFTMKGFGGEYIRGICRGFGMIKKGRQEGRKIPFRWSRLPIYARIQLELWVNVWKRLAKY